MYILYTFNDYCNLLFDVMPGVSFNIQDVFGGMDWLRRWALHH